jgi:hypothetical protein
MIGAAPVMTWVTVTLMVWKWFDRIARLSLAPQRLTLCFN